MEKEVAKSVCLRLIRFLEEHQMPYMCIAGSLLGLVRGGDIIAQDTDIDLATYMPFVPLIYRRQEKLIERELYICRLQKGPKLLRTRRKIRHESAYGKKLTYDVIYMWRISISGTRDFEWDANTIRPPSNFNTQPAPDTGALRYVDVYGFSWLPLLTPLRWGSDQVIIPENPGEFLHTVYGDWETPVKREEFSRPASAEPALVSSVMYSSDYGVQFHDPLYPYIKPEDTEDLTTIEDFLSKFQFLQNLMPNARIDTTDYRLPKGI
jgi:hypothetical protein